jgi:hypothetical protein
MFRSHTKLNAGIRSKISIKFSMLFHSISQFELNTRRLIDRSNNLKRIIRLKCHKIKIISKYPFTTILSYNFNISGDINRPER